MRHALVSALTSLAIVAGLGAAGAQDATPVKPSPGPAAAAPATSNAPALPPPAAVKVDIVLTRTNGGKTLSSLPYSLTVAQGRPSTLRLGSQVPILSAGQINYQNVGSSIDCDLAVLADGRYRLGLSIDDSSLANENSPPVIRSYRMGTMLVLRNGEKTTFNVATDKVSGDTIRADVTLTALK